MSLLVDAVISSGTKIKHLKADILILLSVPGRIQDEKQMKLGALFGRDVCNCKGYKY